MTLIDEAWEAIFRQQDIFSHNFDNRPFKLTAQQIKQATRHFSVTGQREVRILCKQDTRNSRPAIFKEKDLFILPVRNGEYVIVKGEGYVDIPAIKTGIEPYTSALDFPLITSRIGNSEMQHLDFAYANSIIRNFMNDETLVLTVRGRKYTPKFDFRVGSHLITAESVQTEVDAGYEGRDQLVLIEAKNSSATNTIIRQLFYPFKQWKHHISESGTDKDVSIIFFEKAGIEYRIWQFMFADENNYNSIQLVKSRRFRIM